MHETLSLHVSHAMNHLRDPHAEQGSRTVAVDVLLQVVQQGSHGEKLLNLEDTRFVNLRSKAHDWLYSLARWL